MRVAAKRSWSLTLYLPRLKAIDAFRVNMRGNMAIPSGPTNPVFYSALYKNLSSLVQSFVKIFFTPATYKAAFFTGTLTATLFAGVYTLPKTMGGGTYAFEIGVPGPDAGNGIGFLIAVILGTLLYALHRRRTAILHG